jgi:hypothetical protein
MQDTQAQDLAAMLYEMGNAGLNTDEEIAAVIKDQGRYDKRDGRIVTCYNCGKKTQMLTQCRHCGAP